MGTHKGYVQVWDVAAAKRVNVLEGHTARVGALAIFQHFGDIYN